MCTEIMSYNKLKIGEFSRLCRVTVRTLRHYEEIGLLVPEIVDMETGYRYYSVHQMQKMNAIRNLKEMGFSLKEIMELWDEETHIPSVSSLEKKISETETELERLKVRRTQLKAMMASLKKKEKMEKIYIESLPAITVASYRGIIPSYAALGQLCCEVIGPEMARLGCECPEPGYCFTIEHGGYKPADIDIEYCEMVTKAGKDSSIIKFRSIPEVPTAVCMKAYGPYDRLYRSYQELFAWIEKSGYEITGAPRANYVDGAWNQDDPEKWLTIIQVPVEKADK